MPRFKLYLLRSYRRVEIRTLEEILIHSLKYFFFVHPYLPNPQPVGGDAGTMENSNETH